MKTRLDLTPFEKIYDNLDKGHDRTHLEEVRSFALELAKMYCPDKLELVYVAATLHDIGLSVAREGHEQIGHDMAKENKDFQKSYTKEEQHEILEAIREHRASSGNPQGVVAKIVSDADKTADGTNRAFQRAYAWGLKHRPLFNHQAQVLRAAQHLYNKFGPNGTGTRLYFEESRKKLEQTYKPIFEALKDDDLLKMESLLSEVSNPSYNH